MEAGNGGLGQFAISRIQVVQGVTDGIALGLGTSVVGTEQPGIPSGQVPPKPDFPVQQSQLQRLLGPMATDGSHLGLGLLGEAGLHIQA